MVCLGVEPGAAGWKAQMNPLSYGDTPKGCLFPNYRREYGDPLIPTW